MSAIHDGPRLPGALTKLHTSVKLLVHSHNRLEPYNLSGDVLSINMGKNIKGVGQATIELPPRINYLNAISSDDYVNIYFNKGDGKGWVRTFFGLVDRVEESYSVTEEGTPTTRYYVICSDFMKIFERTQYYTNPHLASRDDFVGESVGNPMAGMAIRSNGLFLNGGPADMVANIIFSLLGFSGQYTLPSSYVAAFQNTGILSEHRGLRLNFAEALMNDTQQNSLGPAGLSGLVSDAQSRTPTAEPDSERQLRDTAAALRLNLDNVSSISSDNPARYQRLLEDASVSSAIQSLPRGDGSNSSDTYGTLTESVSVIARGAIPGRPPTVLDLINIGTFVERAAIDGYTFTEGIANYTGPILQLLNQYSNDIMNELYFDLRPISSTGSGLGEGALWSTDPDELGGNVGPNGEPMGVRYAPSMIMREYPFSTIETIDGSNVTMSLNDGQGQQETYGVFPIGAIWSNKPNVPGRHVIPFPNINVIDNADGSASETQKHLDVATISTGDIQTSVFGRSDTDHINLLGLTSDSFLGREAEYYMKDLAPIVTPIHIQKHGLRVRILSTKFANYEPRVTRQVQRTAVVQQQAADETQEAVPEATSENVFNYTTWKTPCVVTQQYAGQSMVLNPNPKMGTRWGYVRSEEPGTKRMHNGIDIYGITGSPIYAIADGIIEVVMRNGENAIYGNQIRVRHPGGLTNRGIYTLTPENDADKSNDLWSLYNHLGLPEYHGPGRVRTNPGVNPPVYRNAVEGDMRRDPDFDPEDPLSYGVAINPRTNRRWAAGDRVNAGEFLGYLGWSGGVSRGSTTGLRYSGLYRSGPSREMFTFTDVTGRTRTMRRPPLTCHLHFELNRDVRGEHYPSSSTNNRIGRYQKVASSTVNENIYPAPFSQNAEQIVDILGSLDPVKFLRDRGCDLLIEINKTNTANDVDEETLNNEHLPDSEGLADQASATAQAGVPNQSVEDAMAVERSSTGLSGAVDSSYTRNILARWILMQDHWFQHNLEYLSGNIDLARGAPEIRVGYRLDIVDRNLSFYVEGVAHQWTFPGALRTKLTVTRGQANNPYPAYIFPRNSGFNSSTDQRANNSRLNKFFISPDPLAIRNALIIRDRQDPTFGVGMSPEKNILDTEDTLSALAESYMLAVETPATETKQRSLVSSDEALPDPWISDVLDPTANETAVSNLTPSIIDQLSNPDALTQLTERAAIRSNSFSGTVDGANVPEITQGGWDTPR